MSDNIRRGFVRALWGVPSKMYSRNSKVINLDLDFIKYNLNDQPFTTYVFGESNLELLHKHGITNCKLVTKEPGMYDRMTAKTQRIDQYGHKLKTIEAASNDFDEFIFLDWDCMAVRPLPENFWNSFGGKAAIQAHLRSYSMKQYYILKKGATWRTTDLNKRPCASFVYVRGKEAANLIYDTWLEDKQRSDEKTLAMVTDKMMGGWDSEKYWKDFEIDHFTLYKDAKVKFCYSRERLGAKQPTFLHINKYIGIIMIEEARKITSDVEEQKKIITKLLTDRTDLLHNSMKGG